MDQNGEIDEANEVLGIDDFYPYGKRISNFLGNSDQIYGYNGVENDKLIVDFDLSLATFRSLNAETELWMQVEPKAESAYGHSPYNSMFNSPISNADPGDNYNYKCNCWLYKFKSISFRSIKDSNKHIYNTKNK